MRKDSLKIKLRNYIRGYSAPVPHYLLMNNVKAWGYRESNAERRLREMVEIDKIYEPFFTTKEPGKGTGLGLSIVRQLVWRNKGDIKVKSKVGEGTVFTITFPTAVDKGKEGMEKGKEG